MSNCYGYLKGTRGMNETQAVTRCGDSYVSSQIQTWTRKVITRINKDGSGFLLIDGDRKIEWDTNKVITVCTNESLLFYNK